MDDALIVNTPYENAQDFLSLCNEALTSQNVLDEEGNPAFFVASAGSPAWLFALAIGDLYTRYQSRVRDAYNANSAENCSDAKVLDLAILANVVRDTGHPSSVAVNVVSTSDLTQNIPEGTSVYFDNIEWLFSAEVIIAAQGTSTAVLISAQAGSYAVSAGSVFTGTSVPSVLTVTASAASTLGYGYEPISSVRQRIIDGQSAENILDKVKAEISKLVGIKYCKVFFNPSVLGTETLPGSHEPLSPRTAKVVVFGTDSDNLLAETYWSIMNVPSQDARSHVQLNLQAGATQIIATAGDYFTYDEKTWVLTQDVTVPATQNRVVAAYSLNFESVALLAETVLVVGAHAAGSVYTNATITAYEAAYYTGTSSNYITASGQSLPVLYEKASLRTTKAKVIVSAESITSGYSSYLKTALESANGSKSPGENFTSQYLSNYLDNFEYAEILGIYLYDDINAVWGVETNIQWNEIAQFTDDSIEIEEV